MRSKNPRRKLRRSPVGLLLLLLLWSLFLGWGMSLALERGSAAQLGSAEVGGAGLISSAQDMRVGQTIQNPPGQSNPQPQFSGTVDLVTSAYQLGQELYLKNCSTCHIAVPPAVMPTQTWRKLLQEEQHYGISLPRLTSPTIVIVWSYLQTFSRPQQASIAVPYRATSSNFFKALHPKVAFSEPVELATCVTCHPSAAQFNFRRLAPEWQNSP